MATCAWEAWQLESKITMEKIGREKCLIDPKFLKYLKTGCRLGDINLNNWKLSDLGHHSSPQEASSREAGIGFSAHRVHRWNLHYSHMHFTFLYHHSVPNKWIFQIPKAYFFKSHFLIFILTIFTEGKKNIYKIPVSLSFDKLENTKTLTWIFFIFTHTEALCIWDIYFFTKWTSFNIHTTPHTCTHTHRYPHGSNFVEST